MHLTMEPRAVSLLAALLCCPPARAQDPRVTTHPLPVLPSAYELIVEANIANGNYSVYQREVYDGARQRSKTVSYLPTGTVTRINLVDADVAIHYTTEDPAGTCVIGNSIDQFVADQTTGRIYSSNEFLGATPDDVYVGESVARGIRTEAWARTDAGGNGGPPGLVTTLTSEFAVDSWALGPNSATPVRSTLEGSADFGARTFRHVYDFYQYQADHEIVEAEFSIPLPVAFDEADLDGKCNATAIADFPEKRAAVLALPIVPVGGGVSGACDPVSTSSKKKSVSGLSAAGAIGLAVGMFVAGLLVGLGFYVVAKRRAADRAARLDREAAGGNGIGMTEDPKRGGSSGGGGGEKQML